MASEDVSRRVGYLKVLGNRNFLFLWLATLMSRTADSLLLIVMIWFVYGILTHNPLYAGFITAAYYIPTFLFAPYFGKLADTYDRKRLMMSATFFQFIFIFLLFAALSFRFLVLDITFLTVFAVASMGILVSISRSSTIPLAVPKEELTAANSLQQATTQMTRIFGFVAGGILLVLKDIGLILIVEMLIFLTSIAVLTVMSISGQKIGGPRRSGLDGLRYIVRERLFFEITVFLSIVNFTGAGMTMLPAVMAKTVFRSGPGLFSAILISLAIGTVAGNYAVTRFNVGSIVGKLLIATNALDAILYIVFAYSGNATVSTLVAAVIGFAEGISIVPFVTLIQARTPNDRLGGVLAGLSMLLLGSASISMVSSGFLVYLLGVRGVYLLFAILLFVMSAVAMNMKELRNATY
ncbi:MAG: MFS transporter [Candidatus Thermoplasmatota archaeon]|uniref:MFS transporter n=1 Tax=Candidatus Sysuiplasma superficiale TaxID=2823368 RepID=A0A8J8CAV9_9ARCH|nr:MFS transporter [Candidatus Sysuiplasma superficiale]MCL4347228.1 MFS transporter [Candidatus Thermoplasmatota archaeon]MCL5437549.1 MFS transporter [Candidatus Thermoplasmatota archaeon]